LGIGSNVGNRKENIEKAKILLNKNNIRILNSSSFYESLSWPNSKNPKFLNIVVRIKSNLTPLKLILKCKEIEILLGRRKSLKNSPRTCDIDILDYKKWTLNRDIILPHPRMHLRSFVLLPLFEINKAWVHPILKKHIKKLILSLSNRDIRSIKQI
jgi:2-amino-4-hydroxy-6-hydroxymethyldihydropteridine diphosphokinase